MAAVVLVVQAAQDKQARYLYGVVVAVLIVALVVLQPMAVLVELMLLQELLRLEAAVSERLVLPGSAR
jgi:hypothetical protein